MGDKHRQTQREIFARPGNIGDRTLLKDREKALAKLMIGNCRHPADARTILAHRAFTSILLEASSAARID